MTRIEKMMLVLTILLASLSASSLVSEWLRLFDLIAAIATGVAFISEKSK